MHHATVAGSRSRGLVNKPLFVDVVFVLAAARVARTELALGQVDATAARAAEAMTQAREMARPFEHSAWLGLALAAQGLVQQARGDARPACDTWQQALREPQATVGRQAPATVEVARLLGMP
jgi:hypothetical protein